MSFASSTDELKRTRHGADLSRVAFSIIIPKKRKAMTQFEVQKAGLAGTQWTTICRASEQKARAIFQRQLRLYSVGLFRLVAPDGKIVAEGKAAPLFSNN
jgi:hypothetical protein